MLGTEIGPNLQVESHFFSLHFDDNELLDCFLNQPCVEEMYFPLNYGLIQQNQFNDQQSQMLCQQRPLEYPVMEMGYG